MENKKKDSRPWEEWLIKYSHIILIIGLIILVIAPILATSLYTGINFTTTGEIGDTIGGITAPIAHLIGAFLVFISFKTQIRANEIQQDALEDEKIRNRKRDNFNTLLALIKENQGDLMSFSKEKNNLIEFSEIFKEELFRHVQFLHKNSAETIEVHSPGFKKLFERKDIFTNYYMGFKLLEMLLKRIQKSELNKDDKKLLFEVVNVFFSTQLLNPIRTIIETFNKINLNREKYKSLETLIPNDKIEFFLTLVSIQYLHDELKKSIR